MSECSRGRATAIYETGCRHRAPPRGGAGALDHTCPATLARMSFVHGNIVYLNSALPSLAAIPAIPEPTTFRTLFAAHAPD